jgi:four helix bundle protein
MKHLKAYHRLLVWQKGHQLVKEVYEITKKFPKEEVFGLTSQTRRAAVSVVANIVEGHAKSVRSNREFLRFLDMSYGSLAEVEYYLELSLSLKYLTISEYNKVEELRREVGALLHRLILSLSNKNRDDKQLVA